MKISKPTEDRQFSIDIGANMNTFRLKVNSHLIGLALCVIALGVFTGCASAAEKKISIRKNPGVQHLIANLNTLVQKQAATKENHFFIAKYPKSQALTYMLWREQRVLWILELGGENPEHWQQVIQHPRSGSVIDLDKDVVPTKADIGTSNYLVDQDWVNSVVYDAVLNGDLITIHK